MCSWKLPVEFAGYGLYWASQTSNAKSKPGIQCVDLVTLPKTGISVRVSSEVVEMSSHQASARFNHNTVIYVCILEELALWALSLHRRAFKQNDAQDKTFQIEHHRWPERKKKGAEKEEEGYEKKQVEKEGVSHEPGGFSTRFVFFLVYFIAHLRSLKLCFFQLLSGTRNTISLSSLTSPPTCIHF